MLVDWSHSLWLKEGREKMEGCLPDLSCGEKRISGISLDDMGSLSNRLWFSRVGWLED